MLVSLILAITIVQDNAPEPRLRLHAVYAEARRASPRAEAARALADAAQARIASTRLPPDPAVQVGWMNYALPRLAPMDPLGMVQLQLMQMLPGPGKLGAAGRVAQSISDATAARARDAEWDVRDQVAMAFYELYATDRALEVNRETLRLLQDILRTAEAMYRVGEGRQTDVLRAQVAIARMAEDTLRMQAMRTATAGRLNALLDRDPVVSVPSPILPAFPDSLPGLAALLAEAQRDRPMVEAAQDDVAAADAAADLARRDIWPDLSVGVQYGQRGTAMGTERMGSLMIGATVPIFARHRQLQMREEAAAMRRMAGAELATMRAETRAAVVEAHAALVRARNLAALYRTTVIPQAEAAVASALAAYRVGGVDFMTLLDARMTVNEYRQQLSTLDSEQGRAWANLEMLLGRQLFDPGTIAGGEAANEQGSP